MRILAIDVGSSSIKAALFKGDKCRRMVHVPIVSTWHGDAVEIPAEGLLTAFKDTVHQVMDGHKKLDAVAIDTFCPGLVALDRRGRSIAGCITHQDRRSEKQAAVLLERIGADRHLALTGNLPFPGGMASTSLLWLRDNQPDVFKRIDRIGQPTTLLVHMLTGHWVIDPSQAAFLGLYDAVHLSGWQDELLEITGVNSRQLPEIKFADEPAGGISAAAARLLSLPEGCPVYSGIVDTSAAVLGTDCRPGRLVHSAGSTDVLAICLPRPKPAADILTRPLGTGRLAPKTWLAVSTIAAGGSSIKWAHANLFADMPRKGFAKMLRNLSGRLASKPLTDDTGHAVEFLPYLAGDRTSLQMQRAAFSNLTLGSTRQQMLEAMLIALARASRQRFLRLSDIHKPQRHIFTMGGRHELSDLMHFHWPGKWKFTPLADEAIGGLRKLAGG